MSLPQSKQAKENTLTSMDRFKKCKSSLHVLTKKKKKKGKKSAVVCIQVVCSVVTLIIHVHDKKPDSLV